ncbi:MAG: tryptophan synthase subunit alpha [Candidatus Omnitrophica bacterium]|nr:tryptophan synthase subunit alpha [Candidatus Omnitrophota bacterium]
MNRIDTKFRQVKQNRQKTFIAYITAGDPTLAVTKKLVPVLEKAGVDIIELGIPFSDPLADGPTIQAASQRALKAGVNLAKIFSAVKGLRKTTQVPIAFMTYYNPVLQYGPARFISDCNRYGVDGVIIPDLPCEEAKELVTLGRRARVATIFLAAPTSTKERIRNIARDSTGFIYYVSLTGVTGARRKLPPEITQKVRLIKSMTKKPVCIGFGVSTPEQAKQMVKIADGVIVGSAIVKIIAANKNPVLAVERFAEKMAKAIHGK